MRPQAMRPVDMADRAIQMNIQPRRQLRSIGVIAIQNAVVAVIFVGIAVMEQMGMRLGIEETHVIALGIGEGALRITHLRRAEADAPQVAAQVFVIARLRRVAQLPRARYIQLG